MGHLQEFNELFVILEEFQSLVVPLYKSLCYPQFIQDIAQGTEGIVSKWTTTYDLFKGVDRCIQETCTKLGNVACRINFDNLHHIEIMLQIIKFVKCLAHIGTKLTSKP